MALGMRQRYLSDRYSGKLKNARKARPIGAGNLFERRHEKGERHLRPSPFSFGSALVSTLYS
jgi:hypothetical protein